VYPYIEIGGVDYMAKETTRKNIPRLYQTEIGTSGIKWSQGEARDEFLDSLRGTDGVKIYHEMSENDPIVGAMLHAIRQVMREMRWIPRSGTKDPDAEDDNVVFLKENMKSMNRSWTDFMSDVYSFFTYGWALFEQVFERRDGRVYWKKLAHRAQTSMVKWETDSNNAAVGMWQKINWDRAQVYIPFSKCIHLVTEYRSGNPEGHSLLRPAYRPWYYKKNLEEIEAIGIERDMVGLPELTTPEGFKMNDDTDETKAALEWAKDILQNIRNDEQAGLLRPNGWEFRLVPSPGEKQYDVNKTIERYAKEIAMSVLAQFIMLGMERTGSYALAKELVDIFYMSLEGWADYIATTINRQGIKLLFQLNGITKDIPYLVHTSVHRQSLRDMAYFVSSLFDENKVSLDDELKTYLKRFGKLSEYSEVRL